MSDLALRRWGAAMTVVGLTVAFGVSLPSTSARFSAQTRNPSGSSSFAAGEWEEPGEPGLAEIVAAAVCGAAPDAEVCGPAAAGQEQFVPPWLAQSPDEGDAAQEDPAAAPSPAPTGPARPQPSPAPSSLPEPGERCENPDCVREAVHVVGAFADQLQERRQDNPEDVPAEAVRTIADFAQELRDLPEAPEEDLALPEDTREALDALVQAGVLPAFTPECMVNVGQLAALIAEQAAAQGGEQSGRQPAQPAECAASKAPAGQPSEEPAPEPSPQAQAEPQPGTEPEPAPTGEPSEYPSDGPGHRVRRAD